MGMRSQANSDSLIFRFPLQYLHKNYSSITSCLKCIHIWFHLRSQHLQELALLQLAERKHNSNNKTSLKCMNFTLTSVFNYLQALRLCTFVIWLNTFQFHSTNKTRIWSQFTTDRLELQNFCSTTQLIKSKCIRHWLLLKDTSTLDHRCFLHLKEEM